MTARKFSSFFIVLSAVLFPFLSFAQPKITSFSPVSAPVGSMVTISGNGFSASPASNIVYFGAVRTEVITASANTLKVKVPAGATAQPLTVTTGGLTGYSSNFFTVRFETGDILLSDYQEQFITNFPFDASLTDFDSDGKPDIAVPSFSSSTGDIFILKNTSTKGAISFGSEQSIFNSTNKYDVRTADLDGDGMQDLLGYSAGAQSIRTWRNISTIGNIAFGNDVISKSNISVGSLAIADINGDGKPDIILTDEIASISKITVYKNTSSVGAISFGEAQVIASLASVVGYKIIVRDLNNDGKPDIVAWQLQSDNIAIFKNTSATSSISFQQQANIVANTTITNIEAADLDSDNKPELIMRSPNLQSVVFFSNSSNSSSLSFLTGTAQVTVSDNSDLDLGDMDGDGKTDIVSWGFGGTIIKNTSTTGNLQLQSINGLAAMSGDGTCVGDMDGDGKPDIAVYTSYNLKFFRNRVSEPFIADVNPKVATPGAAITITGKNFVGVTSVSFGEIPAASFIIKSATEIEAIVGEGASGNVTVTSALGASTFSNFTVGYVPFITSFSPTSARADSAVSITGKNFNYMSEVKFGNVSAAYFVVYTPDSLVAIPGLNAQSGEISVTNNFGTGVKAGFTFLTTPTICSFSPDTAVKGTVVTIYGTNFLNATSVEFGGYKAASFSAVSDYKIEAIVANGGSGEIKVTIPTGVATVTGFIFIGLPTITSFLPLQEEKGGIVTIKGEHLAVATGVSFGGVPADTFAIDANGDIKASVSNGASGSITVKTLGGTASKNGFTFLPTNTNIPIISSFSPITGAIGTIITITGANFGSTPAENHVFFGNAKAEILSASPQSITVKVLPGSISSTIAVTSRNLTCNSVTPFKINFDGGDYAFYEKIFEGVRIPNKGSIYSKLTGAADFDMDGKIDVIFRNGDSNFIVMKNTSISGRFSFANPQFFAAGSSPLEFNMIIQDLNGDNKPDIIGKPTNSANLFLVFLNISTSGVIAFAPPITYPGTVSGVFDIDNDGRPDLFSTTPALTIRKNTSKSGNLSFAEPESISIGDIGNFAVGDFDKDGKKDFAVTNSAFLKLSVLKNTSTLYTMSFDKVFEFETTMAMNAPISIADINNDGKDDIFIRPFNGNLVMLLNKTANNVINFVRNEDIFLSPAFGSDYKWADINGDGKNDWISGNLLARNVSEHDSVLLDPGIYATGLYGYSQDIIEDFDNDGKPDIAQAVTWEYENLVISRNKIGEPTNFELCAEGDAFLTVGKKAFNYQWQYSVDSGKTFSNISNSSFYAGANSDTLRLKNLPSGWYGYQYRCLADGKAGYTYTLKFTNTWIGTTYPYNWENPTYWSCGKVPDGNTDVFINTGVVYLSSSGICRSLTIKPNVEFAIQPGGNLTITH